MTSAVDAPFYTPEYGFLPAKAARLQEILADYNPYLSLVFVPPRDRTEADTHPFAIQDSSPWRPKGIVRHITEAEMENPEKILAWLFEGDLSKHSVVGVMERQRLAEDAARLMDLKRQEEARQERLELSEALITGGVNGKHYYRHNGKTFRR